MEGKEDAKGWQQEIRFTWETAGHNHSLTIAVLGNRLFLPEEGIAPGTMKEMRTPCG